MGNQRSWPFELCHWIFCMISHCFTLFHFSDSSPTTFIFTPHWNPNVSLIWKAVVNNWISPCIITIQGSTEFLQNYLKGAIGAPMMVRLQIRPLKETWQEWRMLSSVTPNFPNCQNYNQCLKNLGLSLSLWAVLRPAKTFTFRSTAPRWYPPEIFAVRQ